METGTASSTIRWGVQTGGRLAKVRVALPRLALPSVATRTATEDFAMAVIHKLSVGKALDKLRRSDAAQTRLDEKNAALDEDIQRMTAFTRRIEWEQRAAGRAASDAQGMNERPDNKKGLRPTLLWLAVLVAVGAPLSAFFVLYATLK
jgi:hypothetical protein